ncbi:hypothetical protein ACQKMD_01130 [Viridibacillus sp. NPDC096237]|uniref:hypothetical protein n=1 Tax=Viridibacillus sp. NPDC096237 TaxID=3390721 RepID=UPI003CFDBF24
MKIRKRLPDGSLGPLEEVFPNQIDETVLLLLEAVAGNQEQIEELKEQNAGQQEQIEQLKNEVEELKGEKA